MSLCQSEDVIAAFFPDSNPTPFFPHLNKVWEVLWCPDKCVMCSEWPWRKKKWKHYPETCLMAGLYFIYLFFTFTFPSQNRLLSDTNTHLYKCDKRNVAVWSDLSLISSPSVCSHWLVRPSEPAGWDCLAQNTTGKTTASDSHWSADGCERGISSLLQSSPRPVCLYSTTSFNLHWAFGTENVFNSSNWLNLLTTVNEDMSSEMCSLCHSV